MKHLSKRKEKKLKLTKIELDFRQSSEDPRYNNIYYRIKPECITNPVLKLLAKLGLYNNWKSPKIRYRYAGYVETKNSDTPYTLFSEIDPKRVSNKEAWTQPRQCRPFNLLSEEKYRQATVEWSLKFQTLYDLEMYHQEQKLIRKKHLEIWEPPTPKENKSTK